MPAFTAMLFARMVMAAMAPFFAIVLVIPVTAIAALTVIFFAPVAIVVRPSFVPPGLVLERPPGSPLKKKRRGQRGAHEPKAKIPYTLPV